MIDNSSLSTIVSVDTESTTIIAHNGMYNVWAVVTDNDHASTIVSMDIMHVNAYNLSGVG